MVSAVQTEVLPDDTAASADSGSGRADDPYKLEIGSGQNPTPDYIHVDLDPKAPDVDLVGDVRALFSPDAVLADYPDLKALDTRPGPLELYREIRAVHFIEHIQWIYQRPMFRWFFDLLAPGGVLTIETPDLHWIAKSYLKNHRKRRFPSGEHPHLSRPEDFHWWVNFKLFSGCSSGDYHHCAYDSRSLTEMLRASGLSGGVKARGGTLYARGRKRSEPNTDYYQ